VTEHSPPTVTGTTEDEACPYCGETHGVQPMPAPPKLAAWSCSACGLDWMITVVNPHLRSAYTVHLAAAVAEIHRLR
jgi:ribosomal protein L37AE/L43A